MAGRFACRRASACSRRACATMSRMPACAAAAPAARPAVFASSATARRCRSRRKREAFVLNRVGAGADPAIRLACQLRPETDLSFFQIFLPQTTAATLADLESLPHRRGALSRQHVRGHARLDQARGKAAAVRHRLHRQPLPRRGVAGGDRMRRPTQPVRRRRTTGAVRARDRTRKPPAARRSRLPA